MLLTKTSFNCHLFFYIHQPMEFFNVIYIYIYLRLPDCVYECCVQNGRIKLGNVGDFGYVAKHCDYHIYIVVF